VENIHHVTRSGFAALPQPLGSSSSSAPNCMLAGGVDALPIASAPPAAVSYTAMVLPPRMKLTPKLT
jgi:hypothetical protein